MNLPSREQCQEIIKCTDAFYCSEKIINGYNVELYDYRLASSTDFEKYDAFELRGLCFVENNGVWERNLLMNKFFNINQTDGWMYNNVKDKQIVRIQDKLDGSIISFIKFPNGKTLAKSKMSFDSMQAVMAQKIYDENEKIRNFVDRMLSAKIVPIFELISPSNQIVLQYNDTELRLLQLRSNKTGEYYNKYEMMALVIEHDISFADELPMVTLDVLMQRKETDENIEGWIVTFNDGQMAKIKTNWYLQLHGLIGPDAFRENLLIETILNGNIDDVLSNIVEGNKKDMISNIADTVEHKFNHLVVEFKKLRFEFFNVFSENKKEFAIRYSKTHPLFSAVIKTINTSFIEVDQTAEKAVRDYIIKNTSTLTSAKAWIEENRI